jgi:uncharacterized protein YlxW (UPF0749 family)
LWRAGAPLALLCAGLLFATSATNARGTDLRPSRNTTLAGLVEEQSRRSASLVRQHAALTQDIEKLQAQQGSIDPALAKQLKDLSDAVGTTPVTGPGLTVTLKDAPSEVVKENPDVDADWLVIHQQDIQAVVNALWAGGADAISIQNHRVISTTGIKCVGNSVVLHGVPYLPPYKITAIGDRRKLQKALDDLSEQVGTRPVTGPGLTVTLQDAPPEVVKENPDVDENWLVIHQQDIQAVVNALWAGGAEAMTIQNQRVISTTGVKCVGNSVVLHGVPYLPPYQITAIGDRRKLQKALDDSQYIQNLQDYVVKFQLGYDVKNESSVQMPAYEGTLDLQTATVPGFPHTPSVSPSVTGR